MMVDEGRESPKVRTGTNTAGNIGQVEAGRGGATRPWGGLTGKIIREIRFTGFNWTGIKI